MSVRCNGRSVICSGVTTDIDQAYPVPFIDLGHQVNIWRAALAATVPEPTRAAGVPVKYCGHTSNTSFKRVVGRDQTGYRPLWFPQLVLNNFHAWLVKYRTRVKWHRKMRRA